jgi:RES domain-containing protein
MGGAKRQWMEEQERGWSDPDTSVCDECVTEVYLAALVRASATESTCDYCGRTSDTSDTSDIPIACPTWVVVEAVANTIGHFYSDPDNAGVPYDEGEYALEPTDTANVLAGFPTIGSDVFHEALVECFDSRSWVPTAKGDWASSNQSDELEYSWTAFTEKVKYSTRYHFAYLASDDREELGPIETLVALGEIVTMLGLVRELGAGTSLYRVRVRRPGESWEPNAATMGAPPAGNASAGRMNPPGISYFYAALQAETAFAEVCTAPPLDVVAAKFALKERVPVIDFCDLPERPSVFDPDRRDAYQKHSFLTRFVHAISRPVRKDGSEHVSYVPTQVVCEWFSQVFTDATGQRLAGLVFPSAVLPGGKNVVFFPSERSYASSFTMLEFESSDQESIDDWADFVARLGRVAGRRRGRGLLG